MTKKNKKKGSILKAIFLAFPFVIIYFIVRNLPVEPCEFLHEETYNAEGELDYCGADETGFVDLSVRKWPMSVDFRPLDALAVNQLCKFEIKIEKADGSPLTARDVALSHTQKIHLLIVNESLDDYQHLHPVADPLFDGVWHFSFTPNLSGKYQAFLDFIPIKSPRRVLLSSTFKVDGGHSLKTSPKENLVFVRDNLRFEINKTRSPLQDSQLELTLAAKDEMGKDVTLYSVMGAFAHMVAFDSKISGFAHLHPLMDTLPLSRDDSFTGSLTFGFSAPKPGIYRLWAQVKTSIDKEMFIPFDLEVGS